MADSKLTSRQKSILLVALLATLGIVVANRISPKTLEIEPPIAAPASAADGAMIVGSRAACLLHFVDANGALRATVDPAAGGNCRLFGAFHILPLPST